MKWALVCKPEIKHVQRLMAEIDNELGKRDQEIVRDEGYAAAVGTDGAPLGELDADVFLTVGGDGTILHTLAHTDKPVLSINAGGVGFLTEVEPKYAPDAIDRVIAGDYELEERRRLAAWLSDAPLPDAVNEVTLQTAKIAKLIKYRLSVDDEVVDTFRGDGIIVSTSTGSTGYSMSVGGPILHPSVQAMVLSHIAPFRLSARPIVIPLESRVELRMLERTRDRHDEGGAKVVVDGQTAHHVPFDSVVRVEPSERRSRFIRFDRNFYGRVRTKLIR